MKDITKKKESIHLARVLCFGNVTRLEEVFKTCLVESNRFRIHINFFFFEKLQVAPDYSSLKTNEVYLLFCPRELFLWIGPKAPLHARAKGRFISEAIHSTDYKSRGSINILGIIAFFSFLFFLIL